MPTPDDTSKLISMPRNSSFHQAVARAAPMVALLLGACEAPVAEWTSEVALEPQLFAPDVVSTDQREYGISFTPDGREAYFTRRSRRGPAQIFVTTFDDGSWSQPELAPFSSEQDEAPFITADGSRMLFSSRRPVQGSWDRSDNIWVMDRLSSPEGDRWGEPTPLQGIVNQPRSETDGYTTGAELGPSLLANGSLLYWTRVDAEWRSDLYIAEPDASGAFTNARPLRINSYGDESNPAMSPDGRYLIFQGYRDPGAYGEQDLYVSERTEYGWSDPMLLPEPINSARNDGYPSFSPDGRLFFFASDRESRGGYYDIYYVEYEALGLRPEHDGS